MWWLFFFFFKQKTAYEMRISDWSSDVCSSDLAVGGVANREVGCAAVDFDPVALRIDQEDARIGVLGLRAGDQSVQIEGKVGALELLAVLLGDRTQAVAVGAHSVQHGGEAGWMIPAQIALEVGQRLVATPAQARRHDGERGRADRKGG